VNAWFPLSLSTGNFILASLILGFFFGFFLERAGFSSALKLTGQFYFRDFSVLKVMFSAIVVAMLGLAWLSLLGVVDMGQVYVPDAYLWPQIVGGLLLGAGFIVGGYCPGTSVVAAATGKLDGFFFLAGIFAGIFGFGVVEPAIHDFNGSGLLGPLTLQQLFGTSAGVVAFCVAAVAIAAFAAAEKSEGAWQLFRKTYGRE
jgi:uncharacterized protein